MKKEMIEYGLLKKAAKGGPIPPFTPEEEAVYPQLEFAKLIDVNVYSREWWLTAAGRIELGILETKIKNARWSTKLKRAFLWLFLTVLTAVIVVIIDRLAIHFLES